MISISKRSLAVIGALLCSVVPSHEARATLLGGTAELVVSEGQWSDSSGSALLPFGLDPSGLVGTRATARFTLDTDRLPADSSPDPLVSVYVGANEDPPWVTLELEIDGVVRSLTPDDAFVNAVEGSAMAFPDEFDVGAGRLGHFPDGTTYPAEALGLAVVLDDLGHGEQIPSDLELTHFYPNLSTSYFWRQYEFDADTGAMLASSELDLTFEMQSISMHPVPEPSALALMAVTLTAMLRTG